MAHVTSASEDPPEERTHCRDCGFALCAECEDCPNRDPLWSCHAAPCVCRRVRRALSIPDDRWQEALDEAEDAAVDDAKVRELEGV